jgi:hypothetical protein
MWRHTPDERRLSLFLRLPLQGHRSFTTTVRSSMSSEDKKVCIRTTSDENVREYHLGEKLTDMPYAEFFQPLYGAEQEIDQLGEKGKKFADRLMDKVHAETISRITLRPFSVRIYKQQNISWATVEGNIVLPALKSAFGAEFQPIQYGTAKYRELVLS